MQTAGSSAGAPSAAQESASLWAGLATAADAPALCQAWLALQCRALEARAGVVLWRQADGGYAPAAVWPHVAFDVTYLGDTARQALSERRGLYTRAGSSGTAEPLGRSGGERVFVAYPVGHAAVMFAVAVLELRVHSDAQLQSAMQALHWGAGWLQSRALQQRSDELAQDLKRLARANDLVAVVVEHADAKGAMIALVNALADTLEASRTLLGVVRKGHVKLRAISHTASFDARTQTVSEVENLMEEALDQGETVSAPAPAFGEFRVNVAHEEHRQKSGLASVTTIVLPGREQAIGLITIESAGAEPLAPQALELAEAAALLVGPVLEDKLELGRWVSGRGSSLAREGWARLTGRGHATFKLGALALALLLAVLAVAEQEYRVTGRAVIEGEVQRAAVAPFRGYVARADVRAGQTVGQGDVLAVLDDRDLLLERTRWSAELEQATQKYRDALAKKDRPAAVLVAAQMREAQAQLDLVEEKLARSRITAPIGGLVVAGDLSQLLGSPVETGQTLFEIAPLDAFRVVIQVDERDITMVRVGQEGRMVLAGAAGDPLGIRVKNVTAISEPHDGRNVFRVEAEVIGTPAALRPGMEGVGKVSVGERSVLWVWTHRFTDWLRLSLWRWLP